MSLVHAHAENVKIIQCPHTIEMYIDLYCISLTHNTNNNSPRIDPPPRTLTHSQKHSLTTTLYDVSARRSDSHRSKSPQIPHPETNL